MNKTFFVFLADQEDPVDFPYQEYSWKIGDHGELEIWSVEPCTMVRIYSAGYWTEIEL